MLALRLSVPRGRNAWAAGSTLSRRLGGGRRLLATQTSVAASPSPMTATESAYWTRIPRWENVGKDEFISYSWQTKNSVQNAHQLVDFMSDALPEQLPQRSEDSPLPRTANELIEDVRAGMRRAPMAVKLTPNVLSLINWRDPLQDPLMRQFVPLLSRSRPDHPKLTFDSLGETEDSPVKGLIHRYPDKAVFLDTNQKQTRFLPINKKWEVMFDYIERTPALADILVSGGDSYMLSPEQLQYIGERLLTIPHILRVRIASKGVAICPSRIVDPEDEWTNTLINLSRQGRKMGKSVSLHTHFNHPNEITWIARAAAQRLFEEGVMVRNQTVLLNGVNNQVEVMKTLIRQLASINIQPYYVFQCDMVHGIEDMRTPLYEILHLESQIRGSIAGFMTPNFIVTLPGGGGKRLACSYDSYDRTTGLATFTAPNSKDPTRKWEYWDPLWSLPQNSSHHVEA